MGSPLAVAHGPWRRLPLGLLLLAVSALAAGAAARPTRPGRYYKTASTTLTGGGVAVAAASVGEGQAMYHCCDM